VSESSGPMLDRARRFLLRDLWSWELQPRSITGAGLRLLQFAVMVSQGFVRDQLFLRASALTYMTVLSLIPILAIALAIVNALGVSENLAALAVNHFLAASDEARARIIEMVKNVNLSGLGTVGVAVLLLTTVLGLRHVEQTLNEIWGVYHSRSWLRRFTDYLAVIVVAPLFVGTALSLSTTLEAEPAVKYLLSYPLFAQLHELGLSYAPMMFFFVGFSLLYWFMPNTSVRVRSALLGGIVAAVLFPIAQHLYVALSVGVTRYSALFGGFAQIPILLVWIYISWSIVLFGAEVSYAHQNLARYRREVRGEPPGSAEREALGVRMAVEVARTFRDRAGPWTAEALADALDASVRTVRDVMQQLEQAGIVIPLAPDRADDAYQLGRPAEDVALAEVLLALRGTRDDSACDRAVGAAVEGVFAELDRSIEASVGRKTLADLLGEIPGRT